MISLRNPIKAISTAFSGSTSDRVQQTIWQRFIEEATPQDYLCLYINIPFCSQHCSFCEYPSRIASRVPDTLLDRLEERFRQASAVFGSCPISVIMFGGGSPSLLSPLQIRRIADMLSSYWNVQSDVRYERGFEAHPNQLTDDHIEALKYLDINRLSLGVQSFHPQVLAAEHRTQVSPERLHYIIKSMRPNVIEVNIDLLTGLRKQTSEILLQDLQKALYLLPESITIYELNPTWNHSAKTKRIGSMLSAIAQELSTLANADLYIYGGTETEEHIEHCNRFRLKSAPGFTRSYSPVPMGFNNIISFSLDDSARFTQHAWSVFPALDVAYEQKGSKLYVYSITKAIETDRPFWDHAFEGRN